MNNIVKNNINLELAKLYEKRIDEAIQLHNPTQDNLYFPFQPDMIAYIKYRFGFDVAIFSPSHLNFVPFDKEIKHE